VVMSRRMSISRFRALGMRGKMRPQVASFASVLDNSSSRPKTALKTLSQKSMNGRMPVLRKMPS
jgi:hypothetical protein